MNTLETIASSATKIKIISPAPQDIFPIEQFTINSLPSESEGKFPKLSLEFLDQIYFDNKVGCNMPKFSCVSLFNPNGEIAYCSAMLPDRNHDFFYKRDGHSIFSNTVSEIEKILNSKLVQCINSQLDQIKQILGKPKKNPQYVEYTNIYTTYKFQGILPEKTRKIAKDHCIYFNKNLFLICDAENAWEFSKEKPMTFVEPKRDPLLVGIEIKNNTINMFLLDKFDVTLAEDYITKEFIE